MTFVFRNKKLQIYLYLNINTKLKCILQINVLLLRTIILDSTQDPVDKQNTVPCRPHAGDL